MSVTADADRPDPPGSKLLPLAVPACDYKAGEQHPEPWTIRMGCPRQPTALGHWPEAGERPEDHLDGCLECRAALTACLREGCRAAEDAFTPIVDRAARGALDSLGVNVRTPRGEDLLSEAMVKGWSLLLHSQKCAPRTVLAGKKLTSLGGYLYSCMRNKVIDQFRKERDPELPLDDLNQMPGAGMLVDDGVVNADQEKMLWSIITDYHREQAGQKSALRARLFAVWLEEGLEPVRSQEEAAALVTDALGRGVHQSTVSRQFSRFRKELLARIEAAPEIDDHTRRLARQLFAEGRRSRPERTKCDGGTHDA